MNRTEPKIFFFEPNRTEPKKKILKPNRTEPNWTEPKWIETMFQNCMKDNEHHILLRSTSLPRTTAPTVGHYWKTLGFYRIREEYVKNRRNPSYCIPTGSFGMSEYQCSYENHDQSDTFQYPTTCSQHPVPRIPRISDTFLSDPDGWFCPEHLISDYCNLLCMSAFRNMYVHVFSNYKFISELESVQVFQNLNWTEIEIF